MNCVFVAQRALVVAACLVGAQSAAGAAKSCVTVEPGKSLGPIQLGMKRADLAKIRLPIKPGLTQSVLDVGPYRVVLGDSGVTQASIDLGAKDSCLKAAGRPILTAFTAPEAVAAWLGGCGPKRIREGGNMISCPAGVDIGQSMAGVDLRVVPVRTTGTEPACAAYLVPGDGVYVVADAACARKARPKEVEIKQGETTCGVGHRFDTSVREPDVLRRFGFNTCRTDRRRGATTVTCPYYGVQFVFAGPPGALARLAIVPVKR